MTEEEAIAAGIEPKRLRRNELTERVIHTWVKGDYLQAPVFQNKIMDVIHERIDEIAPMTVNVPGYIWEKTVPGSMLRKWLVDYLCADFQDYYFDLELPLDLESELFRKMFRGRRRYLKEKMLGKSWYHVDASPGKVER